MPSVSFDTRSLLLGSSRGRDQRLSIAAATFDPSLVDRSAWPSALGRLRSVGFNAVSIRVPWSLHEPNPGRMDFTGRLDVRAAIEAAGALGLRVLVRIGPCVGGSFALDGMPAWMAEVAGDRTREANPAFLDRVARYWHRLAAEFADLQATRDGNGAPRYIVAIGIEDAWQCLDADVGAAYFGALVRFAREAGFDAPLFTANNCWYLHEGLIDGWRMGVDGRARPTATELRQVQPDAPPLLLDVRPTADEVVGALAARADFIIESGIGEHLAATGALGAAASTEAAIAPRLHRLRRPLVFATSFGPIVAGLLPDASSRGTAAAMRGPGRERLTIVGAARRASGEDDGTSIHVAADGSSMPAPAGSAQGVDFYASDLEIAGSRLERSSGSLVGLLGDLVVVAGRARSRIRVKVDGSDVAITVPADGAPPKVVRVRGLRIAAVSFGLADGIGLVPGGFEFIDADGAVVATLMADGTVARPRKIPSRTVVEGPAVPALGAFEALSATGFLDGTDARFASVAKPQSLGAYGIEPLHAYYRARLRRSNASSKRLLALPFARVGSGRIAIDGVARRSGASPCIELPASKAGRTLVAEIRAAGFAVDAAPLGSGGEIRTGVFGPLVELAPLKGVKSAIVPMSAFDGTRLGRFVLGYDSRDPARAVERTLRWTFPARTTAVVMRFPSWWVESSCASRGDRRPWNDALRLNGAFVVAGRSAFSGELVWLDGSKLSPMRPKALAKGEKPPKGKAVQLVPGMNEVLLDVDGSALATREREEPLDLERLRREIEFHEVRREVEAEWAFARVEPPATWVGARRIARRGAAASEKPGTPTWFRTSFRIEAPSAKVASPGATRGLRIELAHAAGATASVFLNGTPVLADDGTSGTVVGKGRSRRVERSAPLPESSLRVGDNELALFVPDGVLPGIRLLA